MDDGDPRRVLRGATYRGDGAAVVEALGRLESSACLQLGGDGLVLALDQQVVGSEDLADRWIARLRDRDGEGDAELADQIAARLGAPSPMLRPLPVELDALADVLEGDPTSPGGRIDLATGDVWPIFADFLTDMADDEDEEREWLEVPCYGSRPAYRDMEAFIATIDREVRREALETAIQGRGAFRRFKDSLAEDERTRWHGFSEERRRGRARAWLADQGFSVGPRRV
ncbi:UPF0158 family protein [Actinomycetospora sp. CA-084318]|uniref:UPF0158 family protein n=1 Tax=Actinomycetospora sp. CA-084318 TaxID=3239892 RepID=UPI003D963FAA